MDFPEFASLSPDDPHIADLVGDDWLANTVHVSDLTDLHDDAIAASLAALSGRDEDDPMGLMSDRMSARGSSMRPSFSMNDLQTLQQPNMSAWNHKLVSVKPKLPPVPESGPCNGGPLNLMPLPSTLTPPDALADLHLIPGLDDAMDEFADFDSDVPNRVHKHLPSTGSLAQQLQMTHVGSNHNLAGLDQPQQQPSLDQMAAYSSTTHQMTNTSLYTHANGDCQTLHGSCQRALNQGALRPDGSVGGADGMAPSSAQQRPTGLPLRKSQSALELSSWRSFSGLDEYWDLEGSGGDLSKAWKLTPEDRMHRIQRYREKRLNRNFNHAVKYHCRKSLADTRPRVRGRFARNDDVGIVLPHESNKALRERDRTNSSSTDGLSSDQTSSGGAGGASSGRHGIGTSAAALASAALGGGVAQVATSPLTGVFMSPPIDSMHAALSPHSATGSLRRVPSCTHQDGSSSSAMTSMPGISVIGATPEPLLKPDLVGALGALPLQRSASNNISLLPPLTASTFLSMPPVIGPSTSSGAIYGGPARCASPSLYPCASSQGLYNSNSMMPYMSAGQTIFSGQTIFTGGNSAAAQSKHCLPAAATTATYVDPRSASMSVGALLSLPLQPISPAASDTHSNNLSVGLSIGDISSF